MLFSISNMKNFCTMNRNMNENKSIVYQICHEIKYETMTYLHINLKYINCILNNIDNVSIYSV